MTPVDPPRDRGMSVRAWGLFVTVAVLWGIPYAFIKIAVDDGISPGFLAWARVVLAAGVLLGVSAAAGILGQLRGRWRWIAAYALVEIAIPFPLIGFGEQRVSSSLTAILIAAAPSFVALLALRLVPGERITGTRLVGLVVGLGGVVALVGIDVAGSSRELVGAAAILLAALGYAVGPMILSRRLQDLDARATMAGATVVGGLLLTPLAIAHPPHEVPSGGGLAAIAVLGLLCTALAFVTYGRLVGDVGPGRASIVTYVAPVFATALGVIALDEHVGAGAAVGLVLILAGSWLSTGGRLRRRRLADPPPG
ncbi:DMT family transporter [Patulibacter sp. NPDC049589]|uniref:DMT family transporter n=1 Tax=Patulibacter sp. NPDC049589 TaxID=3154731 RepID=UPI0034419856